MSFISSIRSWYLVSATVLICIQLQSCAGKEEKQEEKQWIPPSNPCFQMIDVMSMAVVGPFVPKSEDDYPFVEVVQSESNSVIWVVHHLIANDTLSYNKRGESYERTFYASGKICSEENIEFLGTKAIIRYSYCDSSNSKCGKFLNEVTVFERGHVRTYGFSFCNSASIVPAVNVDDLAPITALAEYQTDNYFWRNKDTLFSCDELTYFPWGRLKPTERLDTLLQVAKWSEYDLLCRYIYWGKE